MCFFFTRHHDSVRSGLIFRMWWSTGHKSFINSLHIYIPHIYILMGRINLRSDSSQLPFSKSMPSCGVGNSFISDAWLVAPPCSLEGGISSQQGISSSRKKGFQLNYLLTLNLDCNISMEEKHSHLVLACFPADAQCYSLEKFWITIWFIVSIFHCEDYADPFCIGVPLECWLFIIFIALYRAMSELAHYAIFRSFSFT